MLCCIVRFHSCAKGFLVGGWYGRGPRLLNIRERSDATLKLVPLSQFDKMSIYFSDPSARLSIDKDGIFHAENGNIYELCIAEEDDLPELARFIVAAFGADAIRVSQDMNAFERLLIKPAAEFMNGYSGIIAFSEVLLGLRKRLGRRLSSNMDISPPSIEGLTREEKILNSSQESVVLVLARRGMANDIDVIASVELRLEICDAKIPFTLPWLDRIERRAASLIGFRKNIASDLKPYLSTLCVDERYRGNKIARALVHCVEHISVLWGHSRLYLHVDPANKAAYDLYLSENYRDVRKRWSPFWAGEAAKIGYFVKDPL